MIQIVQRFIQWCYTETRNKTRLIFLICFSFIEPRYNPRVARMINQTVNID